jgi:hypothetical protein
MKGLSIKPGNFDDTRPVWWRISISIDQTIVSFNSPDYLDLGLHETRKLPARYYIDHKIVVFSNKVAGNSKLNMLPFVPRLIRYFGDEFIMIFNIELHMLCVILRLFIKKNLNIKSVSDIVYSNLLH